MIILGSDKLTLHSIGHFTDNKTKYFRLRLREAFKKKPFFCDKCPPWGGGVWSGSMSQKKTIASKSFLSNFKHF